MANLRVVGFSGVQHDETSRRATRFRCRIRHAGMQLPVMKRSRPSWLLASALACRTFSRISSCGVSWISGPRACRARSCPARRACTASARGRPRAGPGRRRPGASSLLQKLYWNVTPLARPLSVSPTNPHRRARRAKARPPGQGAPAGPRRARASPAGCPSFTRARGLPRRGTRARPPRPGSSEASARRPCDHRPRVRQQHLWYAAGQLLGAPEQAFEARRPLGLELPQGGTRRERRSMISKVPRGIFVS